MKISATILSVAVVTIIVAGSLGGVYFLTEPRSPIALASTSVSPSSFLTTTSTSSSGSLSTYSSSSYPTTILSSASLSSSITSSSLATMSTTFSSTLASTTLSTSDDSTTVFSTTTASSDSLTSSYSTSSTSQSSSSTRSTSTSSSSSTSTTSTSSSYDTTTSTTTSDDTSSTQSLFPIQMSVNQVIEDLPDSSNSGGTFCPCPAYILSVTVTNLDSVSHYVGPGNFILLGAETVEYSTVSLAAMQHPLPGGQLNSGSTVTGQIAFQIEGSDSPADLYYNNYNDNIFELLRNLPAVSSVVSEVTLDSSQTSYVDLCLQATSGCEVLNWTATIQNSTYYFYTGQVIEINFAAPETGCASGDSSYSINSVSAYGYDATNGNTQVPLSYSEAPQFPISVPCDSGGSPYSITLFFSAPTTSFASDIQLVLTS